MVRPFTESGHELKPDTVNLVMNLVIMTVPLQCSQCWKLNLSTAKHPYKSTQLYRRVCPSVDSSVRNAVFFAENERKRQSPGGRQRPDGEPHDGKKDSISLAELNFTM